MTTNSHTADHVVVTSGESLLSATREFMDRAGQLTDDPTLRLSSTGDTRAYNDDQRVFRRKLLDDEYEEYLKAERENDPVEILDGLLDIIVVAWGNALDYFGVDVTSDAAKEVLWSNLAKVIGKGLPIFREDGKVVKPPGWTPPLIEKVLRDAGFLPKSRPESSALPTAQGKTASADLPTNSQPSGESYSNIGSQDHILVAPSRPPEVPER